MTLEPAESEVFYTPGTGMPSEAIAMKMKPRFSALGLLAVLPPLVSAWGGIDEFFQPFEYLDLSRTYEHFSGIIDLTI